MWSRNVGDSVRDVAVADLDGDGKPEIVVGTDGGMVRVLSAGGETISTLHTEGNVTRVAAADINGDGSMQVVAATDSGFVYGGLRAE